MWEDVSSGFLAAPLWAQIGMVLFAFTAVVMFVSPSLTRRRYTAKFAALADAAGAPTTRRDEFTEWFAIEADGRRFEVRRELRVRGSGGGSSYRGPTGYLLITSTPLAGSRWELHQLEIVPGRLPSIFGAAPLATGDETFDARFLVRQDGDPVREGWLDPATRAAVTAFFDTPGVTGSVWVEARELRHLASAPWTGIDPASLPVLLRQQAALASALERTAGWRGPTA
ncbi:MAG: hypothetical protein IPK07_00990 [Deltaproteobacteria bacterium]|jgi:hypothetical protein|nr:hypothetical protein [Deltaproteobacteria bacterium]